jgi:hypothetical protein
LGFGLFKLTVFPPRPSPFFKIIVKPIDKQEVSIAACGTMILKKGDGLGGKTVSLNKPKPKPLVQAPVAGAVHRRKIPVSEFRLFYDRGDLPVTVEH